MLVDQYFKVRVSRDMKQRVQVAAQRQLVNESIWLRQAIDAALRAASTAAASSTALRVVTTPRSDRLYVRLHREDRLLLNEPAAARSMAPATYLSVLARAHLRSLSPLPKNEIVVLKRLVAELGAMGRNLNQIALAMNRGQHTATPNQQHVLAMLKLCEGLRDNTRSIIKANIHSWASGYAEM